MKSHTVKIEAESRKALNGYRVVKGLITYPMAVTSRFFAYKKLDTGKWTVLNRKGKTFPEALSSDVIRGLE